MGSFWRHLGLCLWKSRVLSWRQPITTLLQYFLPSALLAILLIVKTLMPASEFKTCQFRARPGPSAGPLAMFQGFACNIQNNCHDMKDFQDVPTYPGSKMDIMVKYFEPILYNDTVLSFSSNIPNAVSIINGTSKILNDSILLENYIEKNGTFSGLFYDKDKLIETLKTGQFDDDNALGLSNSILRMGMIIGDLVDIDIEDKLMNCSDVSFRFFMPSASPELVKSLQKSVCSSPERTAEFIEKMQANTDFDFVFNYFKSEQSTGNISMVANSVKSGLSLIQELTDIMKTNSTANKRKKRNIDTLLSETEGMLAAIEESLTELRSQINEKSLVCMLESSTDKNIMQIMQKCNMSELIEPMTSMISKQIPIWKNVTELLESKTPSDSLTNERQCKIDVNRFVYLYNKAQPENIADKFEVESMFNCTLKRKKREILDMKALLSSMDTEKILANITKWRDETLMSSNWTSEAMAKVENIIDSLSDVALMAETIPELVQNNGSQLFSDPTLFEGLILNQAAVAIDKISKVVEESEYFFKNTETWDNYTLVFKTIDVIKEDLKSKTILVKDIASNWTNIKSYLEKEANFAQEEISEFYDSVFVLDTFKILAAIFHDYKPELCNPEYIKRYLYLPKEGTPTGVTYESLSKALCDSENILPSLVENLKMSDLISLLSDALQFAPENFAQIANVSLSEMNETIISIDEFGEIYSELESSLMDFMDEINVTNIQEIMNTTSFDSEVATAITSNFLCGGPLRIKPLNYKPLDPIDDDDDDEPTAIFLNKNCAPIYSLLSKTWSGKVAWRYIQPILQGRVYFTPDEDYVKEIIEKSQPFFDIIANFRTNVLKISDQYEHIKYLGEDQEKSELVTTLTNSMFLRDFSKSKAGDIYNMKEVTPLNLTDILGNILEADDLLKFLNYVLPSLKCINTDRFEIFSNETDALNEVLNNDKHTFLALASFESSKTDKRKKRAVDSEKFPKHVQYTIRMSYDSVPITSDIKEKLWVPGPDGDFFYNMRYFWGFLQLQDLIENSVIEKHTGKKPDDTVILQQFPYPCFQRDNFLSGIYTAQILQVALIFGFSALVATFVREFIWERESKNGQLLEVMGMKFTTIWTANFLNMLGVFNVNAHLISIILYFGGLLPRTGYWVTFLALFSFCLACMSFIFLMSVLLSKPASGAVISFLIFIISFLPFIFVISMDEDVSDAIKTICGFFMTSSFGFTFLYITRYEQQQQGLQFSEATVSPLENDNFSYLHYLLFNFGDCILYLIIAILISKMSRIDGTWIRRKAKSEPNDLSSPDDQQGILVKSLRKEFRIGKKKRIAVEDLNMNFKKDEITGLLGHNGAGKSTTMSMLIGMLAPDKGTIYFDGKEFDCLMDAHRSLVGYCPQHGILYEMLTIEEHLKLYSTLKATENKETKDHINDLIAKMGLEDKRNIQVRNLSEGLRRRLSIAIAFAGKNSCVVILDEPTAGVDSVARRKIWEFINENKKGKTIIISTHHMDEAEILCDNIAIMHRGNILSEDSTLHLKEKYGGSLQLNISQGLNSAATTKVTSVCSSRLSLQTPTSTDSDPLDFHVSRIVPAARKLTHSAHRRSYALPIEDSTGFNTYQELFALLENEKEFLDISTFSISSANLEDVFLTLTDDADSNAPENMRSAEVPKINQVSATDDISKSLSDAEAELESDYLLKDKRYPKSAGAFQALIKKRIKRYFHDKRMILTSLIIPIILLVLSLILGILRPKTTMPKILLTPSMYGPESYSFLTNFDSSESQSVILPPGVGTTCMKNFTSQSSFIPCTNSNTNKSTYVVDKSCECKDKDWFCDQAKSKYNISRQLTNTTDVIYYLPKDIHPNKWILDTHYELIKKQYGGWNVLNKSTSLVYYNNKGFHTSAAYLNAMNNARLRSSLKSSDNRIDYGISLYSEPIKISITDVLQQSIIQHVADYTLALFMLASVSFVPSSSILFLIEERISEERLVLKSLSVGPVMYYVSTLIWDFLVSIVFTVLAGAAIQIFGISAFTGIYNFIATLLLILFYCLTISTFTYIFQNVFSEPSYGQVVIFTFCIFTGVITLMLMLLTFMYWWIKSLADARKVLITALLVLPPYALGGGLLDLITGKLTSDLKEQYSYDDEEEINPFSWDMVGKNLTFMGAEIIIFLILAIIHELFTDSKSEMKDDQKEVLKLQSVVKDYSQGFIKHRAVSDVNIDVQRGECYGLIGLNGAGKSTIFRMITGSVKPTEGKIIFGCDRIGYCPQSNSLDDHLSVNSHLEIYASIAGYTGDETRKVATYMMKLFDLEPYTGVPCGKLSGGNKRKVCAATAMLGRPDLILLDEPTSGMDPATRRIVWKVVGLCAKKGQSVILTSHSLVECDILCDLIGIMVKGELLCTEPPGILREKYGSGYKINLKLGSESSEEKVKDFISQNFASSKFIEHKYSWMKYRVGGKISSILTLLDIAKTQQLIESFTIDVASLEDIFLQITQPEDISEKEDAKIRIQDSVDEDVDNGVNVSNIELDEDVPEAANYQPPPEQNK